MSRLTLEQMAERDMRVAIDQSRVLDAVFDLLSSPRPRFAKTSCSQCGREFGPGDHGFSHCFDHPGYARDRKLARSAAAIKAAETRRVNRRARAITNATGKP